MFFSSLSPAVSAATIYTNKVIYSEPIASNNTNPIPTNLIVNNKHIISLSLSKDFHVENQIPSQRSEGINKVIENGSKTTIYISRTNVKRILSGASVVIGGYTTGTLSVLLGLAGLGATESIKNGVILTFQMIPDWNGQYHLTLINFSWQ